MPFVGLREARAWSLRGAASIAERRGLAVLTYQTLFRLERGQVKNPEPEVLRAVADLYDQDYQHLVSEFVARRYGLGADLTRHDGTTSSALQKGATEDVAARREIQRLQDELDRYHRLAAEATHAAGILARAVAALDRAEPDARRASARRKSAAAGQHK